MLVLGSNQKNIIAKVFGGGNILEGSTSQFMIGDRNVTVAKDMLMELKIQIVSQSVGGTLGRKIQFNVVTGEVKQKMIDKQPVVNANAEVLIQNLDKYNLFVK